MKKIEWRLRAVTRYELTRYETDDSWNQGGLMAGTCVQPSGEFSNLALAIKIGEAMADADRGTVPQQGLSVMFDTIHLPSPKVRAKFTVTEKRAWRDAPWPDDREGGVVRLSAVYESRDGIEGNAAIENHIFGKATPWGSVEMGIANPEAFDRLEKGTAYYVDFIPCPKDGELVTIDE